MLAKVLIIDSDPNARRHAFVALLPAGYDISVAEDSFAAMSLVASEKPNLVLLGDSMTTESGLSLVGRLMSAASTSAVPVLVVADTPEAQLAADRAGARLVIPGPATADALLAAVDRHVWAPAPISHAPDLRPDR